MQSSSNISQLKSSAIDLYSSQVLGRPAAVLLLFTVALIFLSQYVSDFRLDASSDSLVLENDSALQYYQEVVTQYGSSDYLILTYSPKSSAKADLFSDVTLADLSKLRTALLGLSEVDSITSILDVPLMQSPPRSLYELGARPVYIQSKIADRALAKIELKTSPLYRDLLVSDELSDTAMILQLKADHDLSTSYRRRNQLRNQAKITGLEKAEQQELKEVTLEHRVQQIAFQKRQASLIQDVRQIMLQHQDEATLFLGGVPMIATDSIHYVKSDLVVFGSAALLVIILILAIAFHQLVWVVLPLIVCAVTGYTMICILGLLNWPVSIVSSNFLSLLLIITLSLNIHLIVRYRELDKIEAGKSKSWLIRNTMSSKFVPCLYTALTTIVAFASLLVSGIRPVIDFGWMMCLGVLVALLTTFCLFPALATLAKPRSKQSGGDISKHILQFFARSIDTKAFYIIGGFVVVSVLCVIGMMQLTVENRFIDYFKSKTEIYQGMHLIDQKLGGTTPLDIIIDAPIVLTSAVAEVSARSTPPERQVLAEPELDLTEADSTDEFDEFDDESFAATSMPTGHWFSMEKLARIGKIHNALQAMPETGKVSSVAMAISAFNQLQGSELVDDIDLRVMYQSLSEDNRQTLLGPYMSADANQVRLNVRVFESDKSLDRNQFIADVKATLVSDFGLAESQVHLSGMLVLYNNMLNSLFNSQIMTLGMVFLAIFCMFMILFQNIKLAMVAIVPNVFAATFVLGIMGLAAIPLDLMTITIAAISVGIAVDDTIHYVHRFSDEYRETQDYSRALHISATSIGKAMLFTTLVIALGFMILVFSNFVPTVYFGILTGVAMISALIADLVLLPVLIRKFKPI